MTTKAATKPKTRTPRKVGKTDAKATKEMTTWTEVFANTIKNPAGVTLREEEDGNPSITRKKSTVNAGWVIEVLDEKREWGYCLFLNLDKTNANMALTHTLKWCIARLREDNEYFESGPFEICDARLRNVVSDEIVLAAVLNIRPVDKNAPAQA